jgi:hypothetical protein
LPLRFTPLDYAAAITPFYFDDITPPLPLRRIIFITPFISPLLPFIRR